MAELPDSISDHRRPAEWRRRRSAPTLEARSAPTRLLLGLVVVHLAWGCRSDSPAAVSDEDGACPSPGVGVRIGGRLARDDAVRTPLRRLVLMGGGPEDDAAARTFVNGAAGGDVLVLRASGSLTSYPGYFGSLGSDPVPASIETVLTTDPARGGDSAVVCRVGRAEAIWLAGGDQSDYLDGWPSELHDALAGAGGRDAALGGTSAGAMVLAEAAFRAREGSVTSAEALGDPAHARTTLTYPAFSAPELRSVLIDTHFSERGREGRLLAFLARFRVERGRAPVVGVGLDEGTALVIRDGTWDVSGPAGRAVWVYGFAGTTVLEPGVPLDLHGVTRARLVDGDSGSWPPDFASLTYDTLDVVDGAIRRR